MAVIGNGLVEWDPGNNEMNIKRHGISFEEAESVFEDEMALTIHEVQLCSIQTERIGSKMLCVDQAVSEPVGKRVRDSRGQPVPCAFSKAIENENARGKRKMQRADGVAFPQPRRRVLECVARLATGVRRHRAHGFSMDAHFYGFHMIKRHKYSFPILFSRDAFRLCRLLP